MSRKPGNKCTTMLPASISTSFTHSLIAGSKISSSPSGLMTYTSFAPVCNTSSSTPNSSPSSEVTLSPIKSAIKYSFFANFTAFSLVTYRLFWRYLLAVSISSMPLNFKITMFLKNFTLVISSSMSSFPVSFIVVSQHDINAFNRLQILRTKLRITPRDSDNRVGISTVEFAHQVTTFFIGMLRYRAAVDHTNIGLGRGRHTHKSPLLKLTGEGRALGVVEFTAQGMKIDSARLHGMFRLISDAKIRNLPDKRDAFQRKNCKFARNLTVRNGFHRRSHTIRLPP